MTVHPALRSNCTVIWPMRPRPSTAMRSPSCGVARRTPCSAIEPIVAEAAALAAQPAGTRHTRFRFTLT